METDPQEPVTRLQEAVRRGDTSACAALLGAEPDLCRAPSARGGSLLLEAFEREHTQIAELFLKARDDRGITELDVHEAASMGRAGIVQKRLTDDPLVFEEAGPAGFLPLHRAAFRGHTDAVTMLLEMGADPNARARNGAALTAVDSAAAGAVRFGLQAGEFAEVARRLVAAGGDPSLEAEGNPSALTTAEAGGVAEIFKAAPVSHDGDGAP